VLAIAAAGCGGTAGEDRPDRDVNVVLDAPPSGVHAGIYSAVRRGYDEAEGVRLHVRPARRPRGGEFAIVTPGRTKGLVAVMAITQRPPVRLLATTQQTIDDDPAVVRATVHALQRGYGLTLEDPQSSAQDLLAAVPRLDSATVARQLDGLDNAFLGPSGRFGTLDPATLRGVTLDRRFLR
jgi:ABC-type nitrate/sulfonate/bicarbonate transport system substrate-binding protein